MHFFSELFKQKKSNVKIDLIAKTDEKYASTIYGHKRSKD